MNWLISIIIIVLLLGIMSITSAIIAITKNKLGETEDNSDNILNR